ncbi:MAG: amidohydrolase family protein [Bacteroidales bacterium]|nr:amidohydrolase family protein [Bacteroidales bacterium]
MMTLTALGTTAQVDMHCHAVTDGYRSFVTDHGAAMDEGFPLPQWEAERHVAFMDAAGIETALLTMPAPQPWFGNAEESVAACRRYNEECAALARRYPGRFRFCAALPLPDVESALREAVYALDTLGADGVKLATNSYGQYLGDEALDTLMSMLNERRALIIIHPHKPSAVNDRLVTAVPMASYEYLAETTRALLNLMSRNVLVRYPDLRIVVPHCGSFLPAALPRFRSLLPVMVKQGLMQPVDVEAQLSRLWFDLAGAPSDEALDALLTITTPDHLLYGSDYPYVAENVLTNGKQALERRLILHGIDPQEVFSNNARRLLGEDIPLVQTGERIVRVAEVEVYPEHLEQYLAYAREVGESSTATEPGVLTLYSMQDKADPCRILILEIYADQAAYQRHLQTLHFKRYKKATAQMVKSLRLTDTNPVAGSVE